MEPREIWLWTGRDTQSFALWGDPGRDSVRNTLIGRQIGERYAVALDDSHRLIARLPLYGLMGPGIAHYGLSFTNLFDEGHYYYARRYPAIDLAPPGHRPGSVEIEILASCPAQRLHRMATLKQWGFGLNPFRSRSGALHWSALEAKCPPPAGVVRFEAGPFYTPDRDKPGILFNWEYSYTRVRPPHENSREWIDLETSVPRTFRDIE
jgi:hypothetical protein